MHALVLMEPAGAAAPAAELQAEHERFIDLLDEQHRVVLGGGFDPPAGGSVAAYVVRCRSLTEARQVASSDPLVQAGSIRCEVVACQLVAGGESAQQALGRATRNYRRGNDRAGHGNDGAGR